MATPNGSMPVSPLIKTALLATVPHHDDTALISPATAAAVAYRSGPAWRVTVGVEKPWRQCQPRL